MGRTQLEKAVPSPERVRRVILAMPSGDAIERRDRAFAVEEFRKGRAVERE